MKCGQCENELESLKTTWLVMPPDGQPERIIHFCSVACLFEWLSRMFGDTITKMAFARFNKNG